MRFKIRRLVFLDNASHYFRRTGDRRLENIRDVLCANRAFRNFVAPYYWVVMTHEQTRVCRQIEPSGRPQTHHRREYNQRAPSPVKPSPLPARKNFRSA